jgi:hypothetical protein
MMMTAAIEDQAKQATLPMQEVLSQDLMMT